MSASGWMTPISLLPAITETTVVPGVMASAMTATSTSPSPRTGTRVTRTPCASRSAQGSRTAGCSVTTVTTWGIGSRESGVGSRDVGIRESPSAARRQRPNGLDHAAEGEIVGLGGAAREDHVAQTGAHEVGHVLSGRFDRLLCLPPVGMLQAGGVAELAAEERQHRVHHLRVAGCGRVGVEIEAGHGGCLTPNA